MIQAMHDRLRKRHVKHFAQHKYRKLLRILRSSLVLYLGETQAYSGVWGSHQSM